MIQDRLWIEVENVAARYRRLRFWRVLAIGWVVATLIALLLNKLGIVSAHEFSAAWPALLCVAVGLVVICAGLVNASPAGHDWVARQRGG